jgi:hypothetical protein
VAGILKKNIIRGYTSQEAKKELVNLMEDSRPNLQKLESQLREHPGDIELAVALAEEHLDSGNVARAKEVLDKIIKGNEAAPSGAALALRAEVLALRNDWVGAERDCRMARRAGAQISWKLYLKSAYFRWLKISSEGWRPEKISRIASLVMCAATGTLLGAMGVRLLIQGAYIGFFLSLGLAIGFFWGGLAVGGISLWLKALQDRLTPGWDQPPPSRKK